MNTITHDKCGPFEAKIKDLEENYQALLNAYSVAIDFIHDTQKLDDKGDVLVAITQWQINQNLMS